MCARVIFFGNTVPNQAFLFTAVTVVCCWVISFFNAADVLTMWGLYRRSIDVVVAPFTLFIDEVSTSTLPRPGQARL